MKKTSVFAPVVAAGMFALAACSTQNTGSGPLAEAPAPVGVPPPVPPIPVAESRTVSNVAVTGARISPEQMAKRAAPVLSYAPASPPYLMRSSCGEWPRARA